ncbi:rad51 family DNA repair protein [Rhodotorula toruloides]|uniref:Rad51 family DNA repair protein n=1 Tax=Rhodotorula toruloides TaxID=5286 RepID=A0A511KDB7_RHOTO|nr:rad51 family DNA repair protein [Rhodotorula toruloides]
MDPALLADGFASETGLSLSSAVRHSSSVPHIYVDGLNAILDQAGLQLKRGDVVEVQGLASSGKTSLLVHLAATALLPRKAHVRVDKQVLEVVVGGKEEAIAWIDCTSRFDVDRLASILRHYLDNSIQRYLDECLTRLHVFYPSSTIQLAATIQALPEWAKTHAVEEVCSVLIDGMSQFAWADQYAHEQRIASLAPGAPRPADSSAASQAPLRLLLAAIAHLRRTLAPLIFVTQWVFRPHAILPQRSSDNLPFYQHHFAPPHWPSISTASVHANFDPLDSPSLLDGLWPTFPLKLHITTHPPQKPIFRKGINLGTVLQEQKKRLKERDKLFRRASGLGTAAGGMGTEGIHCVVRKQGGVEIGSWEMSVYEKEIVT